MSNLNRNLLWLLGIAALAAAVYYFSDIVAYMLVAWVLSMLGRPVAVFLRKRVKIWRFHMGATSAALLTIAIFYAVIVGMLLLFVPTVVSQARNLATVDYHALGEKLRPMFFDLDVQLHQIGMLSPGESLATKTQEILSNWFKPTLVGDFLGQFLGVAGNVLVSVAAVTFILFFFLQDSTLFTDIIHAVVPDHLERKVQTAVDESSDMLTRYFRGLLIQVFAFSTLSTLLLWILGVKNTVLINTFGGIFNVIPYIGPTLGVVFGSFITVSSNLDADIALLLPMLIKVAAALFAVQALDNNIIGPMIMSKSVQAHPLEIFVVTLAAAKIGGVLGMVIGIPVYTVLRVVAHTFFSQFKVVQRLTDRREGDN